MLCWVEFAKLERLCVGFVLLIKSHTCVVKTKTKQKKIELDFVSSLVFVFEYISVKFIKTETKQSIHSIIYFLTNKISKFRSMNTAPGSVTLNMASMAITTNMNSFSNGLGNTMSRLCYRWWSLSVLSSQRGPYWGLATLGKFSMTNFMRITMLFIKGHVSSKDGES